jgi:hypothetical protein
MTGYKMPKFVEFRIEPLPKSNLCKVLQRQLRHTNQNALNRLPELPG